MVKKLKKYFPLIIVLVPFLYAIIRGALMTDPSGALVVVFETMLLFCTITFAFLVYFLLYDDELSTHEKIFYTIGCIICAVLFWAFRGHLFIKSLFT